jgi:hypothetical protein
VVGDRRSAGAAWAVTVVLGSTMKAARVGDIRRSNRTHHQGRPGTSRALPGNAEEVVSPVRKPRDLGALRGRGTVSAGRTDDRHRAPKTVGRAVSSASLTSCAEGYPRSLPGLHASAPASLLGLPSSPHRETTRLPRFRRPPLYFTRSQPRDHAKRRSSERLRCRTRRRLDRVHHRWTHPHVQELVDEAGS